MKRPSKFLGRFILVVAPVAMILAIAAAQQSIARLRRENVGLAEAVQEVIRLRAENAELPKLRAGHASLAEQRKSLADLPRLRNEARQLRRQTGELASLQAENERLHGEKAKGPGSIPALADVVQDVGQGNPESAVQTFFWAATHSNLERLNDCLYHRPGDPTLAAEILKDALPSFTENFTGFRVVESKLTDPEHALVRIQTAIGGETMPIPLILVGGVWKVGEP